MVIDPARVAKEVVIHAQTCRHRTSARQPRLHVSDCGHRVRARNLGGAVGPVGTLGAGTISCDVGETDLIGNAWILEASQRVCRPPPRPAVATLRRSDAI